MVMEISNKWLDSTEQRNISLLPPLGKKLSKILSVSCPWNWRILKIDELILDRCLNLYSTLKFLLPEVIWLKHNFNLLFKKRIGGVMICMLASHVVDRGFEHQMGQTKDYKIGICCFSAEYIALKKDWLTPG